MFLMRMSHSPNGLWSCLRAIGMYATAKHTYVSCHRFNEYSKFFSMCMIRVSIYQYGSTTFEEKAKNRWSKWIRSTLCYTSYSAVAVVPETGRKRPRQVERNTRRLGLEFKMSILTAVTWDMLKLLCLEPN